MTRNTEHSKFTCPACFEKHGKYNNLKKDSEPESNYSLCNEHYKEGRVVLIPVILQEDGSADRCTEIPEVVYIVSEVFKTLFKDSPPAIFESGFGFVEPEVVAYILKRLDELEQSDNEKEEAQQVLN